MKRAHYRKLAGYDKQIELLLPTYGLDQLDIAERLWFVHVRSHIEYN